MIRKLFILAVVLANAVKGQPGSGSFVFEAIVRVVVGAAALLSPATAAFALMDVFGVWSLLCGAAAIAAAIALRRELSGEWPLPLAGFLSLICGTVAFLGIGVDDLRWVIGSYAMFFALIVFALAFRLRQLAEEMAAVR